MTADDVATVRRFARIRDIAYPLLSDEKSEVIGAFRLINDGVPENSRYYGTAIPQVIVIDAEGIVTRTYRGHGYDSEDEIETIVNRALGKADG